MTNLAIKYVKLRSCQVKLKSGVCIQSVVPFNSEFPKLYQTQETPVGVDFSKPPISGTKMYFKPRFWKLQDGCQVCFKVSEGFKNLKMFAKQV